MRTFRARSTAALQQQHFKIMEGALQHAAVSLGVKSLRKEQKEVAKLVLEARQDVFVSLPTGFGKSVCFQCLPLVNDHLQDCHGSSVIIVVEPTAAVMRVHVEALVAKGLRAAFINHEQTDDTVKGQHTRGYFCCATKVAQQKFQVASCMLMNNFCRATSDQYGLEPIPPSMGTHR